jgi:carboxypeptidase Taq
MKNNNYFKLEQKFETITGLKNILTIAQWDCSTYMPDGASKNKNKELATLSSLISSLESSPEVGSLIHEISLDSKELDIWQLSNLDLIRNKYEHSKAIDISLQKKYVEASAECEFIWRKCRLNNDFKKLEPYLDKVMDLSRQIASIKSAKFNTPKYEILLDQFDPNRRESELDKIFQHTKSHLPEIISKIMEKQQNRKIIPLSKTVDIKTQKEIAIRIAQIIGFDFDRGRIDQSVHPFSTGRNNDVRITTKYDSVNILDNIYNILHEAGHGLYLQNLPYKYRNQPVGDYQNMSFHESQSLLMEMQIGTSKAFLELLSKLLYDEFNIRGNEYSAENLYNLKTTVKPGVIRIEADETTYPMHVIMRYEIEKSIINEKISAKDLPELWNKKIKEYLGISPDSNKDGCMQDIHWVSGLFGYFPTYYMGAIISSMLIKGMAKQDLNIDTAIRDRDFESINAYLNQNLRQHGSALENDQLLELSTGYNNINVDVFLNYLKTKYIDN